MYTLLFISAALLPALAICRRFNASPVRASKGVVR